VKDRFTWLGGHRRQGWVLGMLLGGLVGMTGPGCAGDDGETSSAGSSGGGTGTGGQDCNPRPGAGGNAGHDADGGAGTGTVDLDGGSPMPPGKWACDVDLGGPELVTNCTGTLICCELKQLCYDPAVEPAFCDRPYCD